MPFSCCSLFALLLDRLLVLPLLGSCLSHAALCLLCCLMACLLAWTACAVALPWPSRAALCLFCCLVACILWFCCRIASFTSYPLLPPLLDRLLARLYLVVLPVPLLGSCLPDAALCLFRYLIACLLVARAVPCTSWTLATNAGILIDCLLGPVACPTFFVAPVQLPPSFLHHSSA